MLRPLLLLLCVCSSAHAQVFRQQIRVCDGNTCQTYYVPRLAQPTVIYSQPVSQSVSQPTYQTSQRCPCTCTNCTCNSTTPTTSTTSLATTASLRGNFRSSLMQAARNARKSGDITALEFFKIAAVSRNQKMLDQLQTAVHESAIEEGLASTNAIDWDAIIEFIEKLIPLIIKLIDLFN